MPYYSFLYIKIEEKNKISTHPLAMFITAKSYSLLNKIKKDLTRGRDVPLIFILRSWCRDSNPGWLSQPLLWRVVLTSCTVRVLA